VKTNPPLPLQRGCSQRTNEERTNEERTNERTSLIPLSSFSSTHHSVVLLASHWWCNRERTSLFVLVRSFSVVVRLLFVHIPKNLLLHKQEWNRGCAISSYHRCHAPNNNHKIIGWTFASYEKYKLMLQLVLGPRAAYVFCTNALHHCNVSRAAGHLHCFPTAVVHSFSIVVLSGCSHGADSSLTKSSSLYNFNSSFHQNYRNTCAMV
jgi:hypothetical protein